MKYLYKFYDVIFVLLFLVSFLFFLNKNKVFIYSNVVKLFIRIKLWDIVNNILVIVVLIIWLMYIEVFVSVVFVFFVILDMFCKCFIININKIFV